MTRLSVASNLAQQSHHGLGVQVAAGRQHPGRPVCKPISVGRPNLLRLFGHALADPPSPSPSPHPDRRAVTAPASRTGLRPRTRPNSRDPAPSPGSRGSAPSGTGDPLLLACLFFRQGCDSGFGDASQGGLPFWCRPRPGRPRSSLLADPAVLLYSAQLHK